MQALHKHFIPVATWLLLSIVSCSSKTQTNQQSTELGDENSALSLADPASAADPTSPKESSIKTLLPVNTRHFIILQLLAKQQH